METLKISCLINFYDENISDHFDASVLLEWNGIGERLEVL